jgi:tRNA threonylcarbamoyl adenosine modification protein (Sua5/YciO/YrdC/YwlC family)
MNNTYFVHPQNPQKVVIRRAVEALIDGGVIIYPTDTVYGIGCDITKKQAIERIVKIKSRTPKKPFSFICCDLKQASQYAGISNFAHYILKRFLPGPYTFVLPAAHNAPKLLQSKQRSVGVRIPNNAVALELVKGLGSPIVSTSANLSDDKVLTTPEELMEQFSRHVDMILECGQLFDTPSTIISLLDDQAEIIRKGAGDVSYFL